MSEQTLLNNDGFRMMFTQSPTPQILYSPDGTILDANPALLRLLNYSQNELVGLSIQDIIVPAPEELDTPIYLGEVNNTAIFERTCNRKDPTTLHTHITVYGLTAPSGDYIANVALFNDITALHEWRYRLQLFTHDISLPLSVIYSISSMLVKETPPLPAETVEEFLSTLYSQSQYARELLLNLNQFSTTAIAEDLSQETVNINHFLRKIREDHRTLANQKGLTLSYIPIHPDIYYDLNPVLMRQAISNLIDNAIKYTPQDGIVELSATVEDQSLIITVCDNGLGIPEADQSKVFERYFRVETAEHRAIAGTGLGLSIIQGIVTQHHGKLWVESQLGKGSTFFIALPLSKDN